MTNQVTLHIEGGRAAFGAAGIELTPWFTRHRLQIPWANAMFVSPVPAVRRSGGEWLTYRGEHITPTKLRSTLRFYIAEPSVYLSTERAQRELGIDAGARLNAAA